MINLFKKRQYVTVPQKVDKKEEREEKEVKVNIPDGLFTKCDDCGKIVLKEDIEKNLMKCPNCNKYFRMTAWQRIKLIIDEGTFLEYDKDLSTLNPLSYPDYEGKIKN